VSAGLSAGVEAYATSLLVTVDRSRGYAGTQSFTFRSLLAI
jgi:hypothetical protein